MNGQNSFEKFLRFRSPHWHPPIFVPREVKFIKLLKLEPGFSCIADIGIKQTKMGKCIPNFQRNYKSNSFSLGYVSNFVNFVQILMLFLAYDKKKRLMFDEYFPRC